MTSQTNLHENISFFQRNRFGVQMIKKRKLISPIAAGFVLIFIYVYFKSIIDSFMGSEFFKLTLFSTAFGLVLIGFLMTIARNRIYAVRNHFLWGILLIICLSRNKDIYYGHYFAPMAFSIALLSMVSSTYNTNWISSIVKTMILFTIIHSFATIILFLNDGIYFKYIKPFFPGNFATGYKSGLTSHYSTNGIYLGLGLIVVSCRLFTQETKGVRNLIIPLSVLFALLLTTKRAHLLFSVMALCIVFLALNSRNKRTSIFKLIFVISIVFSIIYMLGNIFPEVLTVFDRFINYGEDITGGRALLYEVAWEKFLENPIFGIGWGGFQYEFAKLNPQSAYGYTYMTTHNVFLQLLCETGIIGFTIFLLASGITVKKTYAFLSQAIKKNTDFPKNYRLFLAISLGIQAFFLMYCMTGNPLYDIQVQFPYFLSCGIFYSIEYQLVTKKRKDSKQNYAHAFGPQTKTES